MRRVYELGLWDLCSSALSTEGMLDRFHTYERGQHSKVGQTVCITPRIRYAVNNAMYHHCTFTKTSSMSGILTQRTPSNVGSVGHPYPFHGQSSASNLQPYQTCPLVDHHPQTMDPLHLGMAVRRDRCQQTTPAFRSIMNKHARCYSCHCVLTCTASSWQVGPAGHWSLCPSLPPVQAEETPAAALFRQVGEVVALEHCWAL